MALQERVRLGTRRPPATVAYDRRTALWWLVVSLLLLGTLIGLAGASATAFETMVRDPLAIARSGDDVSAVYTGWLSNVGVVVWGVAAGAGLLAGGALRRLTRPGAGMVLTAGVLSVGLMVDDLFQLHESVIPALTPFWERHVMAGWGLLAVVWAVTFRRQLLRDRHLPVLVLGLGWLAVAMSSDFFGDSALVGALADALGGQAVIEEGTKLIGVLCWAGFLCATSLRRLADATALAPDGG